MSTVDLMQFVGAIGIFLFYPIQNWRAFITRQPIGLSFLAFSAVAVGVAGYLALGLRLGTPIFYGLNASNLFFDISILALLWFYSPALRSRERLVGIAILSAGFLALITVNLLLGQYATSISGWIGLMGVVAFYPIQNIKLFVGRNPTGLSLTAFTSLFIGLCGLTAFGVLIGDITVILGNGITAFGSLPIIYGIVFWKK